MSNPEYFPSEERFQPQPTWYGGTLFRSKSEAVFARALELSGYHLWEYEPEFWICRDGWKPDFWALGKSNKSGKIVSLCIEYKPTLVTEAYKSRLSQHFLELGERLVGHFEILACGNAFDLDSPNQVWAHNQGVWEEVSRRLNFFDFISKALRFRFDLAHVQA